jgi:hypothetical protein
VPLWKFDSIAMQDPVRAARLQVAPSRDQIVRQCQVALARALSRGTIRIGFDQSGQNPAHLRPVIQFPVCQQLFDWFFNAHSGYRAQFRLGWQVGHSYNAELVAALRAELRALQESFTGRLLNSSFEDLGPRLTRSGEVILQLEPELSKVWFCKKLIGLDGLVNDLRVELSGPRLVFDDYESWAAPLAEEGNSWLDLKGAFHGDAELYQLKDPVLRAEDLQRLGSA